MSTNNRKDSHSALAATDPNVLAECEGEPAPITSESEITAQFSETLKASRAADLQRGTTLVGPHRDDFLIELENQPATVPSERESQILDKATEKSISEYDFLTEEIKTCREVARAYGSQGQQRTIALALKLAELELIRAITGRNPIVLLDDVTSELDYKRIGYLLKVLQNLSAQTFITATHAEPLVNYLHEASVLTVKNAQISQAACPEKQA